jgi:hypothetical protein
MCLWEKPAARRPVITVGTRARVSLAGGQGRSLADGISGDILEQMFGPDAGPRRCWINV